MIIIIRVYPSIISILHRIQLINNICPYVAITGDITFYNSVIIIYMGSNKGQVKDYFSKDMSILQYNKGSFQKKAE